LILQRPSPWLTALMAVSCLHGATVVELDDSGETLAEAQVIPGPGPYSLTQIAGTLSASNADLFRIHLSGGQFVATTVNPATNFFDTQLFLFDSSGRGIFANDDDPALPPQSSISPPASLPEGWYYLGIAAFGYDPVSTGGMIFPPVDNFLVLSTDLRTAAGPGGSSPLLGFDGVTGQAGRYTISIEGVQTVPEPSYALILLLVCGCVMLRHRCAN
jgi:hypothetical protein